MPGIVPFRSVVGFKRSICLGWVQKVTGDMNGGDYESFVRNVLQDFDDRVLAVQKKAEESITAYEAYCGELKSQLIALKLENESLKRQPGGNDSNVQQLLRAMTGLCIHSTDNSGGSLLRYSCSVMEGALKGMKKE